MPPLGNGHMASSPSTPTKGQTRRSYDISAVRETRKRKREDLFESDEQKNEQQMEVRNFNLRSWNSIDFLALTFSTQNYIQASSSQNYEQEFADSEEEINKQRHLEDKKQMIVNSPFWTQSIAPGKYYARVCLKKICLN